MTLSCHKLLAILAIASIAVLSAGCSGEPSEGTAPLESKPAPAIAEDKLPSGDDNAKAAEDEESTDPNSAVAPVETEAYQPPFPKRTDLFTPPRREQASTKSNRQEGPVHLLGFSNVDSPRAVISIDGAVYPIAEGETKLGIEVVSIKPPAVVLQRGQQVWQASLQN